MNFKLIVIFAFVSLTFTSCSKKTWTCTCTNDSDESIVEISTYKLAKSDAISACENRDKQPDITCVLEER
ncbi:MAG: hypothetical protein ACPG5B_08410 [Chitinophagales bacterium]